MNIRVSPEGNKSPWNRAWRVLRKLCHTAPLEPEPESEPKKQELSSHESASAFMTGVRRIAKVFLASPGDLVEERKAAKSVVDEFNNQLADTFGYQVDLVGWEDTLPNYGRPLALINRARIGFAR